METSESAIEAVAPEDGDLPARHYSTGRLTGTQAGLVNGWRARLLEDRPLPGRPRVSEAARLLGLDNRPPASCSDIIAAAVGELLGQSPDELAVARYSHAGWQAQRAAAAAREYGNDAGTPVYPPVSFYLPAELAEQYEALRARACARAREARLELAGEAARRFPDKERQDAWLAEELARQRIPARMRQVSGGVLARMAIDRWARRSADRVAADAVAYGADTHEQPHRGRRDMQQLRR